LKRSGYKQQILQSLQAQNWEMIGIGQDTEWWDDEHWKLQHQHARELFLYLNFIVDPLFEGPRKKGQGIDSIRLSEQFPDSYMDHTSEVAEISMTKRKFSEKLEAFAVDLKQYFLEKTKNL